MLPGRSYGVSLAALLITLAVPSLGFAQDNTIEWDFPDYVLTVHTQPQHSPDQDLMPMLIGRPKEEAPPAEERFGILFERDYRTPRDPGAFWVYELFDMDAGRAIRRISLDEAFGIVKERGCALTSDEKVMVEGAPRLRTSYQIRDGDYRVTLTRNILLAQDPALPTGRRLETRFEVQNDGDRPLNIRFSLRGRADGYAAAHDSTSVFIVNTKEGRDEFPILVQNIRPVPRRVGVEPRSEENPNPTYEIEGLPISVPPGQSREVMQINHSATTAESAEQAKGQAANLAAFLSGGPAKPELMLMTLADKADARTGEVITYTILYQNIGTAPMTDVLVTNPIPANVSYVEDSAGGRDARIEVNRREPQVGTIGDVKYISWKIGRTILPGEEGEVFFSATVK